MGLFDSIMENFDMDKFSEQIDRAYEEAKSRNHGEKHDLKTENKQLKSENERLRKEINELKNRK